MSFDRFSHIPQVDGKLVDRIVCNLKSQGIFDQFRKDCLADVDTKPAYQNLQQRVNGTVASFLANHTWQEDMNKSQLRESLKRHVQQGFLEVGVDRIVEQVVNPKIITVFLPKVEDVVYDCLGVEKPAKKSVLPPMFRSLPPPPILPVVIKTETSQENTLSLLPKDLDPVSPGSVDFDTSEEQGDVMNTSLQDLEPPPREETSQNDSQMSGISDLSSHSSLHINDPIATESNTNKSDMVPSVDNTTSLQFENFANLNEKIKKSKITYSPNAMELNSSDEPDEGSTEVNLEISDIKMETDESKEEEASNLSQSTFEEFRASAIVQSIKEEESSKMFSDDSRFSVSNHVKLVKSVSVSDHESVSISADDVLKRESNEEIVNEDSQSKSSPCKKENERGKESKRKDEGSSRRQSESSARHHRSHDSKHRSSREKSSRDKEKSSSRSSKDDKPKSSSSKDKHKEEKDRQSEKRREREKEGGRSEHKEDSRSENKEDSRSENKETSKSENKEDSRRNHKEHRKSENKETSRREHKDASKSENKETSRSENKEASRREHKESSKSENKETSRREHKESSRKEHKESSKSENKDDRKEYKEDSRSENKEAGRSEYKESSRKEHKEGNRSENKDDRKEYKERSGKHDKDKISRDKHSKDKDRDEKGKDRHEKDKDKHKEDHEKEKSEKDKIVEEKHKEEKIRDSERTEKTIHSSSSSNRKEDKHRSDDREKSKRSSEGSSAKHRHSNDKSKTEEDKKESRDRKRKGGSCSEEVKSKEARRSWDRDNGEGRGSGSHRSGEGGKREESERSGRKQEAERTEPASNESSGNSCSDRLVSPVVEHEEDTGEERMEEVLMTEEGPSDVDMILMQINKSIEEEKSIEDRKRALAAETAMRPDETNCREVQSPPLKKPKIARNMSEIRKIMLARKNIKRQNMKKHRRCEPQEDGNSHVEEKPQVESTSPALVNLPSSDKIYPEENKENIKEIPQCDSRNKSTVDVASHRLIAESFSGFSDVDIDQSSHLLHCFRTSCIEYCHREGISWSDSDLPVIFPNSAESNPIENKDILNNNIHIGSMRRNCVEIEPEDKKEIIDLMSVRNGCYVRLDKDCPRVAEAILRSEIENILPSKGEQPRKPTISPATRNGAGTMNCSDILSLYSTMETATVNVESAEALLDNLMKESVPTNDNCEEENYDYDEEHESSSNNCDSDWPEKAILDIIASVTATDRSVEEQVTTNNLDHEEESQLEQDEEQSSTVTNNTIAERRIRRGAAKNNRSHINGSQLEQDEEQSSTVTNNTIAERPIRRGAAKNNRSHINGSQLVKEEEQSQSVTGVYNRVVERPSTRRAMKNHIIHDNGLDKEQSRSVGGTPTTNHISHDEESPLEQSRLVGSSDQPLEKSQFKKGKTQLKRIRGKEDNSTESSNNRPQRTSRASQRYDSSDLYKPRPVIVRATKRLSGKISSVENSPQVTQSDFVEAFATKRKTR